MFFCRKNEKIEAHLKTFLDIAHEIESTPVRNIEKESGFVFDPKQFAANTTVSCCIAKLSSISQRSKYLNTRPLVRDK